MISVKDYDSGQTKDYAKMSEISDGYHTFAELYHYRMLYNAAFANQLARRNNMIVHKSWRHADGELCFGKDNYFIVVIDLPTGQISNHYKGEFWDLFNVPERELAAEWDGHTPEEAAKRLKDFLTYDPNQQTDMWPEKST